MTHRLFHHLLVCHSSGAQAVIATDRHLLPVFIPVALESPARSRGGQREEDCIESRQVHNTHAKNMLEKALGRLPSEKCALHVLWHITAAQRRRLLYAGMPSRKAVSRYGPHSPSPRYISPKFSAAQSADWNGVPPQRIMMAPRDQICSPRPVEVASAVEKLRHAGCFPGSQLSILQTKSKLPKALAVNFLTLSFPACAGTKFGRETQARRRRRRRGPQSS